MFRFPKPLSITLAFFLLIALNSEPLAARQIVKQQAQEAKKPEQDSETKKEYWVDSSKKSLREKYSKDFEQNLRSIKSLFGKSGAQLESIKTEDSYVVALMNMFKQRELRR